MNAATCVQSATSVLAFRSPLNGERARVHCH
jgi:hypothetical protein